MNWIFLVCLCITHGAFYYMGKNDGEAMLPGDDAMVEIEKYEIDRRFEHLRWLAERNEKHDG